MIKINNVSKSYNKNENVVDNVSIETKDGEIFGFLGPNGAGKTTIMKMVTGVLEVEEGSIEIDSIDIDKQMLESKKRFGYVSDDADVFLNFKGIEYLNFVADLYKTPTDIRIKNIEYYAKRLKIYDALNQKISDYSHGMRQKIMLVGAFINEPQNLILDEPITGLDPTSIYELKNILQEYSKKGNSVFLSTHILEIAEKLCDRVAIIIKGKIKFMGDLEELRISLKSDETLENLFMELIENNE